MNDVELKTHFESYGEIKEYQIIRDPVSKSSRGFGFVRFYDDLIAQHLITEVQVTSIKGRRVDMRSADLKVPDKIASINRQVHQDTKQYS